MDDLPIARSTLSQHLTELREAGLIQGEFNPLKIKYCIRQEVWEEATHLFAKFFGNKNKQISVTDNTYRTQKD